ncbi:Mu transposase C-terminal domain-containing protein [Polaromonas sp.]|uniref:Mu transposase C-terminal domain-containing protein n=1 Tax=Polaromonas sp. TaxID=1869339 RepID=UPI003BB7FB95
MASGPADLQEHHPLAAQALVTAAASANTALAVAPQGATKTVAASAGAACATGKKGAKTKDAGLQLAPVAHPSAFYQTNQQRAVADARQAVLRQVKRLEEQAGCTTRQAMLTFLTQAAAGRLDGDTAAAMLELSRDSRGRKASNAHVNAAGLPTLRTLQNWLTRAQEAQPGDNLAPRLPQPDMVMEPWMVLAVELKRRPQKPTTKLVMAQMKEAWPEFSSRWVQKNRSERGGQLATPEQLSALAARLTFPSYAQVIRFFRDKFSQLDLLNGQHLGSTLRSHKFYQHRTNAGLEPFVEVHADGWNTHFMAPHPITGEYVSYEVWHFHDVATRYTTPFSVGLSESSEVILKGLENCIRVGGVPAIWQTDSTGSVKNAKVEFDPVASLSARAGLTVVHPQTVGNSQANGIAENYNTRLDRESRALATYMHPERMDSLAFKQVRKFTGQMVKALIKGDTEAHKTARAAALRVGKGILFENREQMLAWLEEVRVRSNNTPHSALKKITDSATGKVRHQTPQEALDAAIAGGWVPVALDESSLVELFHEHVRRVVDRETVKAFAGQRYRHADLGAYDRKEVLVCIDTMDGNRVWVKELNGRLICEAKFVSATGYRSQSMYEWALEKRMNAQIKRKENQIEAIQNRMDPANAPLEVQAIELANAQVLDFGLTAAQLAHDRALIKLAEQRSEEAELTALPVESEDWATRIFGAQAEQEDREREAAQAKPAQEEDFEARLLRHWEEEAALKKASEDSDEEQRRKAM